MSRANLHVMDGTFLIEKPKGRGRFCHRAIWNQIHQDRLARYADGWHIDEIARIHRVRREAIHYSIRRSLARMPSSEAIRIKQQHRYNRDDWRRRDAGLTEFQKLMTLFFQLGK